MIVAVQSADVENHAADNLFGRSLVATIIWNRTQPAVSQMGKATLSDTAEPQLSLWSIALPRNLHWAVPRGNAALWSSRIRNSGDR